MITSETQNHRSKKKQGFQNLSSIRMLKLRKISITEHETQKTEHNFRETEEKIGKLKITKKAKSLHTKKA